MAMQIGRKKYLEERARYRARLANKRESASILDVLPKVDQGVADEVETMDYIEAEDERLTDGTAAKFLNMVNSSEVEDN